MAQTFGQLLAGAGRVATGMREEQEAQRVAQLNEMRLQEARRLEAERRRQQQAQEGLLQQQRQQMQPLEFRPGLDVSQIQRQAQEERLRGYRTDAAETARRQALEAQQQAAQRQTTEQAARSQAGLTPTLGAESPIQRGIAPALGYAQRQTERWESAESPTQKAGALLAGAVDLPISAGLGVSSYLESLGRERIRRLDEFGRELITGAGFEPAEKGPRYYYDQVTGRMRATGEREPAEAPATTPATTPTPTTAFATSADEAIERVLDREGGLADDPVDRGGLTNFGISQRAYPDLDVANLTRDEAARIYKRDYWDFIGADELPENIREIAFDTAVNQGPGFARRALMQSEGDPQRYLDIREERYRDLVERDPSQERFLSGWLNRLNEFRGGLQGQQQLATAEEFDAQEDYVEPEYTQELEAPEPEPRTRQAGVSQESNQILSSGDFYLANPQTITNDMRTVMNQRQNLARMADVYRRAGLGEQYSQALTSLQELDNNLLYLQGMQGIEEITRFRDPRRLAAVMRNATGDNIDYQPRDDGRYNLVRYNAEGGVDVIQEGLTPQEIGRDALLRISAQAREQAIQLAGERATRELELEFFRKKENVKTLNDMLKAAQQGQMELAKQLAGRAGGSVQETTEGIAFVRTGADGQTKAFLYDPARKGENKWFAADIPASRAGFVEVPVVNDPVQLIQTPDVRLTETLLQNWNE